MESVGVSELDLRLLHALQISPRAPWNVLGQVLGVSAATTARRWARLSGEGLAWVTGYRPDPAGALGDPVYAFVTARCPPGRLTSIGAELAAHPQALAVELVSGDGDLLVTVTDRDRQALAGYLLGPFAEVEGLRSSSICWVTRLFTEGSRWRLRALTPDQVRALDAAGRRRRPLTAAGARRAAPGPSDERLLRALAVDGRAPFSTLARESGVSEATVRRRLGVMLESGRLALRCDVAWEAAGWPVTTHVAVRVPAYRLEEMARTLAVLPETRVVAACVGEADLIAGLWLPALADAHRLSALIAARFPEAHVVRWLTGLRSVKRMGRLLDDQGRAAPVPAGVATGPRG